MIRTKAFLLSKGFWGSMAAIVAAVGEIAQNGFNPLNGAALLGALTALYGRWVADKPLSITGAVKS